MTLAFDHLLQAQFDAPLSEVDPHQLHHDPISNAYRVAGAFAHQTESELIVLEEVLTEIAHVDRAFDLGIVEPNKDGKLCTPTDRSLKGFPDPIFHEPRAVQRINLSLDVHGLPLKIGALPGGGFEMVVGIIERTFRIALPWLLEVLFDQPVHHQIRVAANGRSEVCVRR